MSAARAFGHMLAVDARYGFREVAGRFAAALVLMFFVALFFKFLTMQQDGSFPRLSFIDCFVSLFGGMSEFNPTHDTNFNVPAAWLCVCLMGAFVVLSYPTQSLETIGIKQCVAARGRWCWWLSKCAWTVVCAWVYWLLALAVALLMAGGAEGALILSPRTADILGFFAAANCEAYDGVWEVALFVVGVPFALSALYLVQLGVSVNVNPLAAFALTVALLFHAAFYLNGLSVGNYLMLARSNLVIHNGVDAVFGVGVSLVVVSAAVCVGGKAFCRHDLLGKDRLGK